MAKRCPRGFVCTDWSTVWVAVLLVGAIGVALWFYGASRSEISRIGVGSLGSQSQQPQQPQQQPQPQPQPQVIMVQAPPGPGIGYQMRPDIYPEPVQRYGGGVLPSIAMRGSGGRFQQVGILTGEGGSSSSAAPDRTILPLYGRELDARRGRWNYYTRTDGSNPVQVPVRVKNRICDDDTNGCDEIFSDDSIHVPSLGRSFGATVYRKSIFG